MSKTGRNELKKKKKEKKEKNKTKKSNKINKNVKGVQKYLYPTCLVPDTSFRCKAFFAGEHPGLKFCLCY